MTTAVFADDEALLRSAPASPLPLEGDVTVLAEPEEREGAGFVSKSAEPAHITAVFGVIGTPRS
ncbi:hypothetical protein AB0J35_40620 [Nonomuraea angiospora]|uniref:hypothetical protein n=1 Tax=Nonomuraea angiospora TaxID=46172 RepID=UPI00343340E1